MSDVIKGGCLCGAVRYEIDGAPMMAGHCFCTDCRKASGTSHGTHAAFADSAVSFSGQAQSYVSAADSGNMITRRFCPQCGSAICSTNSGMPGMTFIRASSLDNPDAIEPQMTVYASRAPGWANLDLSKPVFAEMPEGGPQSAIPAS